jgi:ABC-type transport system involved in multi-copper enzyme maturation permease subunit
MKVLALLRDTWWQTRSKVIFIILPILMALISLSLIPVVSFQGTGEGEDLEVRIFGQDSTEALLQQWAATEWVVRNPKAFGERFRQGEGGEMSDEELQPYIEAMARPPAGAAVSVIQSFFAGIFLYTLTMLFFIFGAASIMPDTLKAGTVDLLVSKPIGRLRIYLGKYFGGLLLIAANLAIFVGLSFLILTVKSGYANWSYLLSAVTVLFAFAVLNAILHMFGVLVRSSVFSILMGYLIYIVVDTGIENLHNLLVRLKMFESPEWVQTLVKWLWYVFPNFGSMKETSVNLTLGVSVVNWVPILTSGAFGVVVLAFGYWLFRRKEF